MHPVGILSIILIPIACFWMQLALGICLPPYAVPPLALIAGVWLGWTGGPRPGALAGLIAGLFEDLFLGNLIGAGLFSGVLIGISSGFFRQWFWREGRMTYGVLTLAALFIKLVFNGLVFLMGGGQWSGLSVLPAAILFQGGVGAVLAWVVYPIFKKTYVRSG